VLEPEALPRSNIISNEVKKRLEWIKHYETIGNVGIVCLRMLGSATQTVS